MDDTHTLRARFDHQKLYAVAADVDDSQREFPWRVYKGKSRHTS